jgi:Zn finger protein HypA/HybF involved in hydrogenase expression
LSGEPDMSKFEQYLEELKENQGSTEKPAEMKDPKKPIKCKRCGNDQPKDSNGAGAYSRKDFERLDKTGLCPYCKKR